MATRKARPGLIRGLYAIPTAFVLAAVVVVSPPSVQDFGILLVGFTLMSGLLWGVALLVMWPFGLLARHPGTPPKRGGPFLVVGCVVTVVGGMYWFTALANPRSEPPGQALGMALLAIGLTLLTIGGWRLTTRDIGAVGDRVPARLQGTPGLTAPLQPPVPTPPGDAPQGWYPNPIGPGRRYWTGTVWTEYTAPDSANAPGTSSVP